MMTRSRIQLGRVCVLLGAAVLWGAPATAQLNPKEPPSEIRGLEVKEQLGARVPLGLTFKDSTGAPVPLSKYFASGKPVILVLGYYDCPLVCPLVLERLQASLGKLDYTVGENFNVVYVSFDPENTTEMAAQYRRDAIESYVAAGHERTQRMEAGWAFHTSEPSQMRPLADAVGYEYRFLPESGEYSHPVSLIFLSGEGVVSRYIYGFDYNPKDVKLSLLEASQGAIAQSLGDRLLWFCYHYDPKTGRYSLAAFRVMQAGALITATFMGTLILVLKLGERGRRRRRAGRALAADMNEQTPRGVAMAGQRA